MVVLDRVACAQGLVREMSKEDGLIFGRQD